MVTKLKPCGSMAAYARHKKSGEVPCQPCVEANRAYHRAYQKRYYKENRETILDRIRGKYNTQSLAYYHANKEHYAEAQRRRRKENPELVVRYNHERRARVSGAEGSYTQGEWESTIEACGGACAYCGAAGSRLTVDHVQPISKGGSNVIDNILPACSKCNSSKGDKSLLHWLIVKGGEFAW